MSKYIDAEKLYEKVDALMAHYAKAEKEMEDDAELSIFYQGKRKTCSEIISIITSLQQEQPKVDLEKEMTAYIERHFHIRYDETLEVGNDPLTTHDFEEIARHFAEWGAIHLNARKEE